MLKAGIIGLGKMGLSHCGIINAQPGVKLVAVCDKSKFLTWMLEKYGKHQCYDDYKKMIDSHKFDFIFVATPTPYHYDIVKYALERDIHVFCEKPFCLNARESEELVKLAAKRKLINQVGYHNRFLGSFKEAKRLLDKGAIGEISHFLGEAYGPVVLKEQASTWRSSAKEGGGCLADYASHVINLIEFMIKPPEKVAGSVLQPIFSKEVEDAVYTTLFCEDGINGHISVNWSDDTYRKMTTQVTVYGKRGKLFVDQQEVRVYVKEDLSDESFLTGWNTRYVTDVTDPVDFYLRGEEYSAQIEYFIEAVKTHAHVNVNSFASALHTNEVADMIKNDAEGRG
ncbi:Gfo/Idh/MocA family protein [Pseudomonadota bacterium]